MISFEELKNKHLLQFSFYVTKPLKATESTKEAELESFLYTDEVKLYKADKFEVYCTVPVLSKIVDNE
ncbi:MAG: hypothetical protein GQ574_03565 [Crocinitomix sp.]|nr:hypothetical protein [Crocinitomix sp.]